MGRVALLAPKGDSRAARMGDLLEAALASSLDQDVARFNDAESARRLRAKDFQRVAAVARNEPGCGFLLDPLRSIGGTVILDSWELFDLTLAARPRIGEPGFLGLVEALRHGGFGDVLKRRAFLGGGWEVPVANRGVVRLGDAFLVPTVDLAERIRVERNAATALGVIEWPEEDALAEAWEAWARTCAEQILEGPAHRTNRPSLIQSAIEGADQAREARERGEA